MIAHSVAEIVKRPVRLTVEGIDRMYLNVYVPGLKYEHGINRFFRHHCGQPLPSAALMSPMTRSFVAALEDFAARREIPLCNLKKGGARTPFQAARGRLCDQSQARRDRTPEPRLHPQRRHLPGRQPAGRCRPAASLGAHFADMRVHALSRRGSECLLDRSADLIFGTTAGQRTDDRITLVLCAP
jgi:hypothetical protein